MKDSTITSGPKRVTTRVIAAMKQEGAKIACLTAYDFLTARLLDQVGVDLILVGDSLGMVFQGHKTTLPVTLDEMIYHSKAVVRGVERAMVIVDMPFMSYQAHPEEGFRNAGRVMKETGAGGVKFEGGERIADLVYRTTRAGIPSNIPARVPMPGLSAKAGMFLQRLRTHSLPNRARVLVFMSFLNSHDCSTSSAAR